MAAGPVLSLADKVELKIKLQGLCEHYWALNGYKKTSIKELCADIGIGIGTFYSLYPTKEDLFFETIASAQSRMTKKFLDTCRDNPSKEGFIIAMKKLFRDYDEKPFLRAGDKGDKTDYQSFVTKLSAESLERIKFDSIEFFRNAIHIANITLKIDEYKAYGIFGALVSAMYVKDTIAVIHDHLEVFDFMIDNLVMDIFE